MKNPNKFIFTADDIGCIPEIDDAAIDLINDNKLSSIEVFANGHTLENLKQALDSIEKKKGTDYKPVNIGCHLTITSGSPTLTDLENNKYFQHFIKRDKNHQPIFRDYVEQRRYDKPDKTGVTEALIQELNNQISIINQKLGRKIDHLSCHHESLSFFPEYFKAYTEVARINGLNMRSPFMRPEKREKWYYKLIAIPSLSTLNKWDREIINTRDHIRATEIPNWHPKYTLGSHYGPIPPVNLTTGKSVLIYLALTGSPGAG